MKFVDDDDDDDDTVSYLQSDISHKRFEWKRKMLRFGNVNRPMGSLETLSLIY